MSRLALLLTLAVAGFAAAQTPEPKPSLSPQGTDVELAKAHFRTGEIYYQRQRYPDAAREFEEAYRLSNRAELLYNMGKSYDGASDPTRALHAYRRFISALPTSPDRAEVDARIVALQQAVGSLEITASVDGASVTLDGEKLGATPLLPAIVDVNPGQHRLEISAEGFQTYRHAVDVTKGQRLGLRAELKSLVKVVRVEVEKPQKPVYKRWYFWTAMVGVLVVAGGVTGGVLATQRKGPEEGLVLPGVK